MHKTIVTLLFLLMSSITFAQENGMYYFVSPDGDNSNSGLSPAEPMRSIQDVIQLAQPGDTIHLLPGHYYQDVNTVRDGLADRPITIMGTPNAVVHGVASNRIFQVHHDYITLTGFTIDGLRRGQEPDHMEAFREKLLYIIGDDERDGVTGLRVLHMTFRNAGEECLRMKYFAHHNEIAYSSFSDCGIWDFVYGADGVVGEAIYLGTSSNQWEENLTDEPDVTAYNWIHHNVMNTQGNECVEAKEGTEHNIIEYNICTGQQDPNSGGIASRGYGNIIRYNEIYGNVGAGIYLGGHQVDGVQYGAQNHVYGNTFRANEGGDILFINGNQGVICGNFFHDPEAENTVGEFEDDYTPDKPCKDDMLLDIADSE